MLQVFSPSSSHGGIEAKPAGKAALGQYMTPSTIAAFMASLFPEITNEFHVLDAGAGEGGLTCAFLHALKNKETSFPQGEVSLFECDAAMVRKLEAHTARAAGTLPVKRHVYHTDFIEDAVTLILRKQRPFTHAILNPPYKKISSRSRYRELLRDVGIETVNLYTAFVALALILLRPGGTLVAIIPRSFCNGPYYRPFREFILRRAAIRRIHLFTSRTEAFKADKVLQENVILRLERDAQQTDIHISTSTNGEMDAYHTARHPFTDIVRPGDPEQFIHIPDAREEAESFPLANSSLASLGIDVSTGPVVDFRLREYTREMPRDDDAPLLYPGHFTGTTQWPRVGFKKPNAIACCPETMKWLYPNGWYVLVRRLSSKEEKRRITAYLVDPAHFSGRPFLGFENHLNVFHQRRKGLHEDLAQGLALYLNSRFIDTIFRRFNGHTQVNATDLRALPYPSAEMLAKLGAWAKKRTALTEGMLEHHLKAMLT